MSPFRIEVRSILRLALPVVVAQVGLMMLGIVDNVMLGHFDLHAFDASALGRLWIIGTMLVGMGLVLGIDPLVSHAHGAGDGESARFALERGLALALLASVPIGISWCFTEELLVWTGQAPSLAHDAERFALVQLPGLPAWLAFAALRSYSQGRGFVRPAMWVAIGANVLNALGDWILIFGHLGAPRLGVVGAGISTTVSEIAMAGALWWAVQRWHRSRGEVFRWTWNALRPRELKTVVAQGAPVALMLGLEIWAFHIASLWAGQLGTIELGAHTVVLSMASLSFMVPLGISMGTASRVGNLIGASDRTGAQRAAWAGLTLGAATMACFALTFLLGRNALPGFITNDLAVRAAATAILPIGAAFQVFDGLQVVGCGILRGMGRPRPAAAFNLIGYYAFALPIGAWLAFRGGWGLAGLWWGLSLGLALVAIALVIWVARRGPAHAASLAPNAREPARA
ncbi:MAG: MATE family efflux transporter [Planctomycetes bacterium]|nr:MATE family efflux transporter [Planctomycetota bacterium]